MDTIDVIKMLSFLWLLNYQIQLAEPASRYLYHTSPSPMTVGLTFAANYRSADQRSGLRKIWIPPSDQCIMHSPNIFTRNA